MEGAGLENGLENSDASAPLNDHVCLTLEVDDIPIHFQFILLAKQCYVWVCAGPCAMKSLVSAMPAPQDRMPAVTTLLPNRSDEQGESMARRITRKTGIPVLLSLNLPKDADHLLNASERFVIQTLERMLTERRIASASLSGP